VTTVSDPAGANSANASNGARPPSAKAGRHREASLYHALHGAGAGGEGRSLTQLREDAREAYERLDLPVWRRSGFWTTSLENIDLDALDAGARPAAEGVPAVVERTLPDRPRAGRIVQSANATVHVELDPELAAKGVVLSSLEDAFVAHEELVSRWYSKRLPLDRDKLQAANAAFWGAGAFLYVPPGVVVEDPFEIVYAIEQAGTAQYGRTLVVGDRASEFRVHEYDLAAGVEDGFGDGQALHAGAFELYLEDGARCRLSQVQDWGTGEVYDVSTRVVTLGRDAYCHWLPALLGGHLVRQHLELAVTDTGADMAFRGIFFAERDEHLDVFAVDLHETGPSGGDVHWRGAATGESRASFEGLIQIDPGSQQTHTYLQIHSMMLSPRARIDAIPSVLVSADDVSASHGGTVGELDESSIFYMQTRGLDRATAVRVIVEGFFEPLVNELQDEPLQELIRAKVAAKLAAAREDIEAYATSR
jgi:Fe-S cluster assembly scaffold protein SufB